MIKNVNAAPTAPAKPRSRRGLPQWLLFALMLAYLAWAWRHLESLLMLVNIDLLSPWAGLLMVTGSAVLALGAARSLYDARLGKYCLLLAAAELAMAAPQIGNWQYKLSQSMLATLALGVAIALLGVCLSMRSAK